jgi:hypothetical protein
MRIIRLFKKVKKKNLIKHIKIKINRIIIKQQKILNSLKTTNKNPRIFRLNKHTKLSLKNKTKKMLLISKKKLKIFQRLSRSNRKRNSLHHKYKLRKRKRKRNNNMIMNNLTNNSRKFNLLRKIIQRFKTLYRFPTKKHNKWFQILHD